MEALQRDAAERIELGTTSMRLLLTADMSGGAMSAIEITMPPGSTSASHIHHREDETFLIVEGSFTFRSDGRVERVSAGRRLFLPRGSRHAFANEGDTTARVITVLVPGGLVRWQRSSRDDGDRYECGGCDRESDGRQLKWRDCAQGDLRRGPLCRERDRRDRICKRGSCLGHASSRQGDRGGSTAGRLQRRDGPRKHSRRGARVTSMGHEDPVHRQRRDRPGDPHGRGAERRPVRARARWQEHANIVFPDARLDAAVQGAIAGMSLSVCGQSCQSGTRLLIHKDVHDEFIERLVAKLENVRIGIAAEETTEMGWLISARQLEVVSGYIASGRASARGS